MKIKKTFKTADLYSEGGLPGQYIVLFNTQPTYIAYNYDETYRFTSESLKRFYEKIKKMGFKKMCLESIRLGSKDHSSLKHIKSYVHEEYKMIVTPNEVFFNKLESDKPKSKIFYELSNIYRELYRSLEKIKTNKKFGVLINHPSFGFDHKKMDIEISKLVDVDKHYNDNFKEIYYKITESLTNKHSEGLFILRSEPGCGKTSIIRRLINDVDRNFIYLNPNDVELLSDPSFISFAIEKLKDSIIIIEDGENVMKKRDGFNKTTSSLLNLTDGLMKDVLNLKFIITINCDIGEIDPALTRNGRLNLIYEFEKLHIDKCKALGFDVSEDTSLADLYNKSEIMVNNKNKIGF